MKCQYCEIREAVEKGAFCSLACEQAYELVEEKKKEVIKEKQKTKGQIYGN